MLYWLVLVQKKIQQTQISEKHLPADGNVFKAARTLHSTKGGCLSREPLFWAMSSPASNQRNARKWMPRSASHFQATSLIFQLRIDQLKLVYWSLTLWYYQPSEVAFNFLDMFHLRKSKKKVVSGISLQWSSYTTLDTAVSELQDVEEPGIISTG